jgi:hypothetical protein
MSLWLAFLAWGAHKDADGEDKLTTYKEKRDFRQTEEPSGQDSVKSSNRRRFVIQKHDATACTMICGLSWMAFSNPGL